MSALYKAINADGSQAGSDTSQTWWYRYDALNRMVTTKGVLSGGTIVRGAMGIDLTYTAAGARAQMITGSGYGQKQESYTYFADGGLDQVSIAEGYGGSVLRADTSRDLLGRVDGYVEYNGWGGVTHERYALQYDLRGQVLTEKTRTLSGSDWIYAHTVNDYSATGAGTPGGEVYYGWYTGSSTGTVLFNARSKQWKNGSNPPSFASSADYALADTYTTYSYGQWRDAAVQTGIVLTNRDGTATSSYAYASDGSLTSVTTWGGAHPKTVSFTNDQQGRVLERVEADYTYSQSDPRERRYRFDGIEMGVVGNNGADDTDYATAIARRNAAQGTGAFRGGAAYGTPFADFDQNYAGVNPSNERGTGSMWTARVGDTLSGIAAALWGDASRWYLIAEANGLGGNGPQGALAAGTSIVIPGGSAATNLFNNANTFKPYDAAKAIGDVQPNAPAPPRGSDGCGAFGQILMVVIAVAVTYFSWGTFTGSVLGPVLGGAAAGAYGVAVSQVYGNILGIRDGFDFKEIALGALGAGIGAGVGQAASALSNVGGAVGKIAQFLSKGGLGSTIAKGLIGNTLTQGASVATGLQDRFDWTGVAAAGVGSFAGNIADGGLASRGASLLANAGARSLIDGTDFGDNVVAALPDAIGQTVGEWAAGEVVGWINDSVDSDGSNVGDFPSRNRSSQLAGLDSGFVSDFLDDSRRALYDAWVAARARFFDANNDGKFNTADIVVTAKRASEVLSSGWSAMRHGVSSALVQIGRAQMAKTESYRQQGMVVSQLAQGAAYRAINYLGKPSGRGELPRVLDYMSGDPMSAGAEAMVLYNAVPASRGTRPITHGDELNVILSLGGAASLSSGVARAPSMLGRGALSLDAAETVTVRAASTDLVPVVTKTLGEWGETRLSSLLSGQGVKPTNPFKTPFGSRYPDRLVDGISYEAKAGLNVKLTARIEKQIAKDAWLIRAGRIDGAEWHFWRGAQPELIRALQNAGIKPVVH